MTIRCLPLAAAVLCMQLSSRAQSKFEFQAGYGMYSLETMMYEPHKHADWILPDMTLVGSAFLTCRYRGHERFAAGLTVNYFETSTIAGFRKIRTIGLSPDIAVYYNANGLA